MKVTRIINAEPNQALLPICKATAFMRADIWRRYGALGTAGKRLNTVKPELPALYKYLDLDGTIRAETAKDVLNDIYSYKEAAKERVRKSVRKRAETDEELKRLYTLLKKDEWLDDNFLHRQMRKHFKHGVAHCANQFVVRSDRVLTEVVEGRLVVILKIAPKYGNSIRLTTTTSGKNVDLKGSNLRVIVKDTGVEIHYCADKQPGRAPGVGKIGVDKGYTEAFADSRGGLHGQGFGQTMTKFSDRVKETGKSRNKLRALEEKHREAGRVAKADRINKNNLGNKKIERRKERTQKRLRTIAFKAAHAVVDHASHVGAEDLSSPICSKHKWRNYNRRMSSWAKGVLAEALENVTQQRGSKLQLVASAYTSQIDSQTGLLEGQRVGDRFYHVSGDVSQADTNAARVIERRMDDPEIGRYTPFKDIRLILLNRSPAQLSVNRVELGSLDRQPTADKLNAHLYAY